MDVSKKNHVKYCSPNLSLLTSSEPINEMPNDTLKQSVQTIDSADFRPLFITGDEHKKLFGIYL